jgi:hypothetical protein
MNANPVTMVRQRLEAAGRDYELLGPLGGDAARVRFVGQFQGDEVVWNACILTLRRVQQGMQPGGNGTGLRQFIEVGQVSGGEGEVKVALNVPAIEAATVRMTMLMLRQWKRLGPGRHEYGEAVHPA